MDVLKYISQQGKRELECKDCLHAGELKMYSWRSRANHLYSVMYWSCCGVCPWREHPHSNTIPLSSNSYKPLAENVSRTCCVRPFGLIHGGTIKSYGSGRRGNQQHMWSCCNSRAHQLHGQRDDFGCTCEACGELLRKPFTRWAKPSQGQVGRLAVQPT